MFYMFFALDQIPRPPLASDRNKLTSSQGRYVNDLTTTAWKAWVPRPRTPPPSQLNPQRSLIVVQVWDIFSRG